MDGLPDMSKETLNFSSDKVGSGSYNMIVAMSKVLEKAGGFQTVNVNPDSPGGMGAPYLFASGNTDLAFINGAPAKWAMEEGTLGKPATSGYAAIIGGLTAVCYINCVSNAFLQKYNVSTIEEIFEQKLPLRIGCSAKGSMDAEGRLLPAWMSPSCSGAMTCAAGSSAKRASTSSPSRPTPSRVRIRS